MPSAAPPVEREIASLLTAAESVLEVEREAPRKRRRLVNDDQISGDSVHLEPFNGQRAPLLQSVMGDSPAPSRAQSFPRHVQCSDALGYAHKPMTSDSLIESNCQSACVRESHPHHQEVGIPIYSMAACAGLLMSVASMYPLATPDVRSSVTSSNAATVTPPPDSH